MAAILAGKTRAPASLVAVAILAAVSACGAPEPSGPIRAPAPRKAPVPMFARMASPSDPAGCAQGDGAACDRLGRLAEAGSAGVPPDLEQAAVLFERACSAGFADGCAALASATALGQGTDPSPTRAVALNERACAGGSARGCAGLGEAYAWGRGVARDDVRAADLLRKGCSRDPRHGCRELARLLATPGSPVRDDAAALVLFLSGCDRGEIPACGAAGSLVGAGRGAAADPTRAAALFQKACDGANAIACAQLGLAHFKGRGVALDPVRGAVLLDQGCRGGFASACNLLGLVYANGEGVPRDDARAESLFRAACERGSSTGCSRLGLCYLRPRAGGAAYDFGIAQAAADCRRSAPACDWLATVPRVHATAAFQLLVDGCDAEIPAACASLARSVAGGRVPRDAAAAVVQRIRTACSQGNALWCRRLAFWHEEGLTVEKSAPNARHYYQIACDGGDARACGDLGRMLALGQGGKQDKEAAEALLTKTCNARAEDGGRACGHLGVMLVHRGTEVSRAEGGRLLERACAQGDGLSCDRLGGFLAVGGKGFVKDEPRAVELLERACSIGARACDEARRLREKIGVSDLR